MSDFFHIKQDSQVKTPSLLNELRDNPNQFDLEQIMMIMHHLLKDHIKEGQSRKIKYKTLPYSDDMAGSVSKVKFPTDENKSFIIYANVLSFFGNGGSLPPVYEEYIQGMLRNHNTSLNDFLSIFYDRFLNLWFKFQAQINPSLQAEPFENLEFVKLPMCLAGMQNVLDENSTLPKAFYIQHFEPFMHNMATKGSLIKLIKGWLILIKAKHVKFEINAFIGGWQKLTNKEDASAIGVRLGRFQKLGKSMVLGSCVWNQSKTTLVYFKHVPYWLYDALVIKKSIIKKQLLELLRRHIGVGSSLIIRISTNRLVIPRNKIGRTLRLGQNSWLHGLAKNTESTKSLHLEL